MKRKTKPVSKRKTPKRKAVDVNPIANVAAVMPAIRPQYRIQKWTQPNTPNPAMLRNILAQEGYSVCQWSDRPGTELGMHKHGSQQSHWVVSGTLEINVQGRGANILGPGDRDFMPDDTYYSVRVIGEDAVLYLIGELHVTDRKPT
ncbi:MAG: hypothetical protein ABJA02_04495 [Acidobacteriota bacterium]